MGNNQSAKLRELKSTTQIVSEMTRLAHLCYQLYSIMIALRDVTLEDRITSDAMGLRLGYMSVKVAALSDGLIGLEKAVKFYDQQH